MSTLYKPFQPTLTSLGLKSFGLSLEYSRPCEALMNVVHSYLQVSADKSTPYPTIPDGTQAVFISPQGSVIGGAQSQACDVQILQPGVYFGIHFYPGALRYFFNLNLSEITNQFVDDHYLSCRGFSDLHHNIYRCHSFMERAQVCEQWLLGRYKPEAPTSFDQALSLIYQSAGSIKVNQVATKVGWSSRHLNRFFQQYVGLSTKTFAQTIRIQSVCRELFKLPADSSELLLESGFYDQSHLIKGFRKILLTSPTRFFSRFMSDSYNT